MIIHADYASPSVFESDRERALLGLSADGRRPVRFHARVVAHLSQLRFALRALGEAIWSHDRWADDAGVADPVVTVHPDRIFIEAFSHDQSAYCNLIVEPQVFEAEGETRTGSTSIDFSAWLWGALGEMRSSRATRIAIDSEGLEVRTAGFGGRFERRVEVPDAWLRGLLQLQAAMTLPGTRFRVRPVDLLAVIRHLRRNKARVSPRALRYVLEPDRPVKVVLEPWEHEIELEGSAHGYAETRTIRTWGRRRLRLIEGLLPFAEHVDVYLKGRALPSFYAVKLPGMTFLLGLSGWTSQGWSGPASFDLLSTAAADDAGELTAALGLLRARYSLGASELARELGVERETAARLLTRLCRQGRVMFDVEARRYRHRELLGEPADEARLFPPDRRSELAAGYAAEGRIRVAACEAEIAHKARRLRDPRTGALEERELQYASWRVTGAVEGVAPAVEIVVSELGQVIFGVCDCAFFKENLLNRGPCEHMLALYRESDALRRDVPSSVAASPGPPRAGEDGEGELPEEPDDDL